MRQMLVFSLHCRWRNWDPAALSKLLKSDDYSMAHLGFKPRWVYSEFYDFPFPAWCCGTSEDRREKLVWTRLHHGKDLSHPVWIHAFGEKHHSLAITQVQDVDEEGRFCNGSRPLTITGETSRCWCIWHIARTHRPGCCWWKQPLTVSTQALFLIWYDLKWPSLYCLWQRWSQKPENLMLLRGYQYLLLTERNVLSLT